MSDATYAEFLRGQGFSQEQITTMLKKKGHTVTIPEFNVTAARKSVGAILHRIEEKGLDPTIRRRIIQRQIADLIDTVRPFEKYEGVLQRCALANSQGDMSELAAGMQLIADLLPPITYGCTLQGQIFRFPGQDDLWRKTKSGCVSIQSGVIYSHPLPDTHVTLVNI